MTEADFHLDICSLPTLQISVFCITDCEWWAGVTLQDCIEAAGRMWGMSGDELAEHVEDAYGLSDTELDIRNLTADDEGAKQTFRQAHDQLCAEGIPFPAFFAGTE